MASIVARRLMSAVRSAATVAVLLRGLAASAPPADAAIPSVFTSTPTPIPCTVQSERRAALLRSAVPRSTVKTFDGVPIDVRRRVPAGAGQRAGRARIR